MELNEIKKKLYKENPTAVLHSVRKDGILYTTGFGENTINFRVPLDELGETVWERNIDAKLLIRYIIV